MKKKTGIIIGVIVAVCAVVMLLGFSCFSGLLLLGSTDVEYTTVAQGTEAEEEKTTEPVPEETTKKQEVTTTEPATEKTDVMIDQFVGLGFTEAEAEEMKEIFATVGITEISNIQKALGDGIDNLQSFTCDVFEYRKDKGGISLHFTIDKRQLCFISLDGIPTTKTDYYYINIFGNVKAKTSNSVKSVTLYDVWDENGEIISDAVGYQAVFDYENKKIAAYEP